MYLSYDHGGTFSNWTHGTRRLLIKKEDTVSYDLSWGEWNWDLHFAPHYYSFTVDSWHILAYVVASINPQKMYRWWESQIKRFILGVPSSVNWSIHPPVIKHQTWRDGQSMICRSWKPWKWGSLPGLKHQRGYIYIYIYYIYVVKYSYIWYYMYIHIYRDIAPQFLGNRLYQIMIFLGINDVILHWFNPKPLR